MKFGEMLAQMVRARASDIHLQAGAPPMVRVDGELLPFDKKPLTAAHTEAMAKALTTEAQWMRFLNEKELDFAYVLPGVARFRCNLLRQRGAVGIVMRVVPASVPTFEVLGLPRGVVEQLASQSRGLVLVTGPTGAGKSTTLAAMVDYINSHYAKHVITIEDPIEYLHRNKRSLVVQREVGLDTVSFSDGLRRALRQDPDVLLIGEMRDRETVEVALEAAQTGHLVLSTLHTHDAVRTINRIIDFFPLSEHRLVRILLAESLLGILSQRLLPQAGGQGRVLAMEILLATPLVRDYIKDEEKTPLIKDIIATDETRGMQTFDQHLVRLYLSGRIDLETALAAATSPHEFRLLVTKATGEQV